MSYQVSARKYRPQNFAEVVGQPHIVRTLSNAIDGQRIAHAYLFSGVRGVGKTTIARVFAKALNCEQGPTPTPCNRCDSCRQITQGNAADVMEIDGASNNGVDSVRELCDNIRYRPLAARYKIYIIDEVHMLSTAAFNALLKTLEEPPEHAVFIFATTETHKIPRTILSRCQHHAFRRIARQEIADHLTQVAQRDGIDAPRTAIALLSRAADGSMRDALSLFDQAVSFSGGKISEGDLTLMLGVVGQETLTGFADDLITRDAGSALTRLKGLIDAGHDLQILVGELVEHFRNLLMCRVMDQPGTLIDLSDDDIAELTTQSRNAPQEVIEQILSLLSDAQERCRRALNPRFVLEAALVRASQAQDLVDLGELLARLEGEDAAPARPAPARITPLPQAGAAPQPERTVAPLTETTAAPQAPMPTRSATPAPHSEPVPPSAPQPTPPAPEAEIEPAIKPAAETTAPTTTATPTAPPPTGAVPATPTPPPAPKPAQESEHPPAAEAPPFIAPSPVVAPDAHTNAETVFPPEPASTPPAAPESAAPEPPVSAPEPPMQAAPAPPKAPVRPADLPPWQGPPPEEDGSGWLTEPPTRSGTASPPPVSSHEPPAPEPSAPVPPAAEAPTTGQPASGQPMAQQAAAFATAPEAPPAQSFTSPAPVDPAPVDPAPFAAPPAPEPTPSAFPASAQPAHTASGPLPTFDSPKEMWMHVVQEIRKRRAALASYLEQGVVQNATETRVEIGFLAAYEVMHGMVSRAENVQFISRIAKEVTGRPLEVVFSVVSDRKESVTTLAQEFEEQAAADHRAEVEKTMEVPFVKDLLDEFGGEITALRKPERH